MNYCFRKKITIVLAAALFLCALPVTAYAKTGSKTTTKTNSASKTSKTDFSLGETQKNKYVNEYFGYSFSAPAGYTFYDEKALAETNEVTVDVMKDDISLKKLIDAEASIIVAYAEGENEYDNVNIGIAIGEDFENEKKLYEDSKDYLKEQLEESGFTVKTTKVLSKKVAGEDHYIMSILAEISGITMYQKQMTVAKGDYIMFITATTFDEDGTDELLEKIAKL